MPPEGLLSELLVEELDDFGIEFAMKRNGAVVS
jgi:hypothetical protein